MTDTSHIPDDPFDADILAAEFALGLLQGDDLTQAERRTRTDRQFAEQVAVWDARFATLTDDIAPVTPPKGLFRKITQAAYPDSPRALWRQLGVIPALLGAAAAALVLILALQLGTLMQTGVPDATLATRMTSDDETLIVAAAYVPTTQTLVVEWEVGERLPGRDVELWLIADGAAPVSLGVLNKGTPLTEFVLTASVEGQLDGAALAVSDEPLGGSPTGAPTGTILAVGEISSL